MPGTLAGDIVSAAGAASVANCSGPTGTATSGSWPPMWSVRRSCSGARPHQRGRPDDLSDPENVELDEWQRLLLFTRAETLPSTAGPTRCSAISSPSGCSAFPEARPWCFRSPRLTAGHGADGDPRAQPVHEPYGRRDRRSRYRNRIRHRAAALGEGADVVISDFHERRLRETQGKALAASSASGRSSPSSVTSPVPNR